MLNKLVDAYIIKLIFRISLLFVLLISFYIFIVTLFYNDKSYKSVFSAWQFPMLLALVVDFYILE